MVRVEGCPSGIQSSNRPCHIEFFFSFKIEETCTLTTFVEQLAQCLVYFFLIFMQTFSS